MLVTRAQMQAAESAAFARGVEAAALMETAGVGLAAEVTRFFPRPGHVRLVAGKGHNAGDILVAGRHLAAAGWMVSLDLAVPEADLAPLTARQLAALRPTLCAVTSPPDVALDGLLGIGARGAPRGSLAAGIERLAALRAAGSFVVAADLPSGLDADTGETSAPAVVADLTVTFGFVKTGLVADAATNHVGRLALVLLPDVPAPDDGDPAEILTAANLRALVPPRPFDSHKGTWGRVGILAGAPDTPGAARLCAAAALRAGAGLITLGVDPALRSWLAPALPAEIMLRGVTDPREFAAGRFDALAVGPGLGLDRGEAWTDLLRNHPGPMVIDADALNLLARGPQPIPPFAGPRLLTPHPGEMDRLDPTGRDLPRRLRAQRFAERHGVTLLLKGARTVIAAPGRAPHFNTTGDPGMGTGGIGDVLTGVCAALLARGLAPVDAARLGAWVCGRAAERVVFGPDGSSESLTAGDVITHLGGAFRELRAPLAAA